MNIQAETVLQAQERILRIKLKDARGLMIKVREGIPARAVTRVVELGFNGQSVYSSIGSRTTVQRKIKGNERLTPEESDRLLRLTRIIGQATMTFGSEEKARHWLERPTKAFGGNEAPFSLLDTDQGAQLVEERLVQIAHGMFA